MAWGRRGGGGRKRERGKLGKVGVRCMLAHLTKIPIRPLKLITSTTCVYFLLVLLPVRSSLSFNSHTSPFLCTLKLSTLYLFLLLHLSWKKNRNGDLYCFEVHLSSFTPTISNMGLNILDPEGGLVPSAHCFSLERHVWWCGLVFTCVFGRGGWYVQNLVLWYEQFYIALYIFLKKKGK